MPFADLKKSLKTEFGDKIPSFKECMNREYFHEFIQQYTLLTKAINQVHSAIFIFRYRSKSEINLLWVNTRYKMWLKEYLADQDIDEPTDKGIAEKLKISPHTVGTHRKKLLAKFKIKNSATLVRVAFELGLQ